jgi:hypothetical protein
MHYFPAIWTWLGTSAWGSDPLAGLVLERLSGAGVYPPSLHGNNLRSPLEDAPMSTPRTQPRHRISRIALFVALGSGLSQGAAVVAGYIPGVEGRVLAVFALVGFVSVFAAAAEALGPKKMWC